MIPDLASFTKSFSDMGFGSTIGRSHNTVAARAAGCSAIAAHDSIGGTTVCTRPVTLSVTTGDQLGAGRHSLVDNVCPDCHLLAAHGVVSGR